MLLKILIGLVVVIVAFVIIVALRPSDFRVTRSAVIAAPASAVFPHVNDLHQWEAWSPWDKLDPNMKKTYEGAAGVGASYSWTGNSQVGEGKVTITESRPNELVGMRLDFVKPFAGTNAVEFTFAPQGSDTVVTWTMTGKYSFVCKAVGLFMDLDKLCGGQFEQGLAQLKNIAEAKPAAKL
jgi:uncharacterized protein YndB with AHSA1/START domain